MTGATGAMSGESSPPLSVLIVDDELPALDELRFLLEQDDAVASVTTANTAQHAVALMASQRFDAVFLDIEMPDCTGLELARTIAESDEANHRPYVVFVTAFEAHAVEAFEVEAVDYVLKPVRPERLAQAVRRIQSAAKPTVEAAESEWSRGSRFGVDVGGKTVFIDRSSVSAVEASRDYVRLHTNERTYLMRSPISVLEAEWLPHGFVRVHRSYLVAIDHVKELRSDNAGTVVMAGALEVPVSRTYARDLKQRLLSAGREPRPSGDKS
jgi:DNA-binding LytR/AlgR family response regulator